MNPSQAKHKSFLFCYKAKAAKRYNNKTKERKTMLYGTKFP